jgi:hypothetical protein
MSFYLKENTFDATPISAAFVLKSEPCSLECSLEVCRAVDEKHGILDIVFLAEFLEEAVSQRDCRGRKQPHMEDFICVGIDGGVQPELLVVDSNHGLVDRDVIRIRTGGGLLLGCLHQFVNSVP